MFTATELKRFWKNALQKKYKGINFSFVTDSFETKKWFYPRYLFGKLHEKIIMELLHKHGDKQGVFFDLGANIGYFTVFGGHLFGEVHAFEMNPALVPLIHKSVESNETNCKTFINNAAIHQKSGEFFSFKPHGGKNAHATNSIVQSEDQCKVQIQSLALDEYVQKHGVVPSILKIDIEGAEYQMLLGMKETLSTHNPVLIMEVHPDLMQSIGGTVEELIVTLKEYGYKTINVIDHRVEDTVVLESVEETTEFKNNFVLYAY